MILQEHHIHYLAEDGYDETVIVTKGEHHILTRMQWFLKKQITGGFIMAVKVAIEKGGPVLLESEARALYEIQQAKPKKRKKRRVKK